MLAKKIKLRDNDFYFSWKLFFVLAVVAIAMLTGNAVFAQTADSTLKDTLHNQLIYPFREITGNPYLDTLNQTQTTLNRRLSTIPKPIRMNLLPK